VGVLAPFHGAAYCVWNGAAARTDVRSATHLSSRTRVPPPAPLDRFVRSSRRSGLKRVAGDSTPLWVYSPRFTGLRTASMLDRP